MSNPLLFSIITVNLNNLQGLQKTLESVFNQSLKEFEIIVIDGGSTDGSKEFLEKHDAKIDYWVSEPDEGIYNGMNKGINVASGKYLFFLNSGDTFYGSEILRQVLYKINDNYHIYYGDVVRVYDHKEEMKNYPKKLSFSFFLDSALAHQSVFIEKILFYDLFFYNEDFKILADWEFLICAICKYNIPYKHLDLIISNYDMTGLSNQEEGKVLMKQERARCYQKHFPLFIEDYEYCNKVDALVKSYRIRTFLELDNKKVVRKFNSLIFRVFNWFKK